MELCKFRILLNFRKIFFYSLAFYGILILQEVSTWHHMTGFFVPKKGTAL